MNYLKLDFVFENIFSNFCFFFREELLIFPFYLFFYFSFFFILFIRYHHIFPVVGNWKREIPRVFVFLWKSRVNSRRTYPVKPAFIMWRKILVLFGIFIAVIQGELLNRRLWSDVISVRLSAKSFWKIRSI